MVALESDGCVWMGAFGWIDACQWKRQRDRYTHARTHEQRSTHNARAHAMHAKTRTQIRTWAQTQGAHAHTRIHMITSLCQHRTWHIATA
eukprot:143715-Rhodomonas_salina.2